MEFFYELPNRGKDNSRYGIDIYDVRRK